MRLRQRTPASRRAAEAAAQAALQAETVRKARLEAHRAAEELEFEESSRKAQEQAALQTAELRRLQDEHAARTARLSVGLKASPPAPPPPVPVPETFADVAAADEADRRRQEAIRMVALAMTPHPLLPPGVSFLADLNCPPQPPEAVFGGPHRHGMRLPTRRNQ